VNPSYIEALTNRIMTNLKANGIDVDEWIIKQPITNVFTELQDHIYQDIASELLELAKRLNPERAR
jgi:hypothetical protein